MGFMEDHLSTKLEKCSELFIVVIARNDVSKTNLIILVITRLQVDILINIFGCF